MDRHYLFYVLIGAFFYALSTLFLKTGAREGVGPVRTTILTQWVLAAGFFLFFYPWADFPVLPDPFWPSLCVGLAFLVGQIFLVLSYTRGDVSVATPVLGSKVLLVAIMVSTLSDTPLRPSTWVAAVLSTLAIILLVSPSRQEGVNRKRAATGFLYALGAATGLAVFDVLIQEWSPVIGFGLLAPFAMMFSAIGSVFLLKFARQRSFRFSTRAWRFLGIGVALLTGQAMVMTWAVGTFGDAAGVNVVYASRGIWSVVLVWVFGSAFGDRESLQDRGVVVRRLVGAVLMVLGIMLVFR